MRHIVRAVPLTVLLVLVAAASWAAANLNLSKSNINRFQGSAVASATASFGLAREGEIVYVTPKVAEFVLTQFCASPANGGIRLAATGFGAIAQTGATLCYSFSPGISLPKDSTVTCATAAGASPGDYFCMISGLLES